MTGTLWLVATPIGNLADMAPRAIDTLATVSLICCEDTRRTGGLLNHHGISGAPLAVCNEHTEHDLIERVISQLADGDDIAVVSDAGTPGISDPGERLVRAALDGGHTVSTIPGPSAAVAALVISGLPTARFVMEGFLPRKGAERRDRLADIASEMRTIVLYEAPHRLVATLSDLREVCGDARQVSVSRELTKMYEQTIRGTLGTIDVGEPRGEYVIIVDGNQHVAREYGDDEIRQAIDNELASGATRRDAAALVARRLGVSRRRAYDLGIKSATPTHER